MGIKESTKDWYNNMHDKTPYNYTPKSPIEEKVKPSLTDYNINIRSEKDNTYDVSNVIEAWNLDKDYYLGNVIKYVVKSKKGDKAKQKKELQKALAYLQKRIEKL
tara:strand:- start:572 stop:886 length:315 start_codon:yes stop_codon:yes gene_type:complete